MVAKQLTGIPPQEEWQRPFSMDFAAILPIALMPL